MDIVKGDYVRNTKTQAVGIVLRDPVYMAHTGQTLVEVQVRGANVTFLWYLPSVEPVTFLHLVRPDDRVAITDGSGHYALVRVIHVHRKCEWASVDYDGEEVIVKAKYITRFIPSSAMKGA